MPELRPDPELQARPRTISCQANTFTDVFITKKLICGSLKTPYFKRFSSTKQRHLLGNNLVIVPFLKLIKDIHTCQPASLINRRNPLLPPKEPDTLDSLSSTVVGTR